jgi:hypothetical protein
LQSSLWTRDDDSTLVSSFAAVADRQYHNLFAVVVIQSDISSVAKVDHPFSKLRRQLFDRSANLWVLAQRFYALPDRLHCTLGGVSALGDKKCVQTGHIQ